MNVLYDLQLRIWELPLSLSIWAASLTAYGLMSSAMGAGMMADVLGNQGHNQIRQEINLAVHPFQCPPQTA
jgi:hypothetical protein